MRGFAAIAVCLYHFVCTTTGYIENEQLLNFFAWGAKGVQMFFIISGVVIPLSMIKDNYTYNNFSYFIKKRFIRIEPPYIATVILGILYLVLRNHIPGSTPIDMTPSVRDTLLHIPYFIPCCRKC
ncbi:acyltransferase family protein [Lentisphaera profundi]|uniref:acyltransferase family protein n=1 Tax=Lentisphaera profundi TaxID=1658616 RepID=UPI003B6813A5